MEKQLIRDPAVLDYHRRLLELLKSWEIRFIHLDISNATNEIEVFWPTGMLMPCPQCQTLCPQRDSRSRKWRHLDIMQFQTFIHCEVPRADWDKARLTQIKSICVGIGRSHLLKLRFLRLLGTFFQKVELALD